MHKRTKALQIPKIVKETVFARDQQRCIICGSNRGMPVAHVIARSQGGLGIEENIVTLCDSCHYAYDFGPDRKQIKEYLVNYLKSKYPGWDEKNMYYRKG